MGGMRISVSFHKVAAVTRIWKVHEMLFFVFFFYRYLFGLDAKKPLFKNLTSLQASCVFVFEKLQLWKHFNGIYFRDVYAFCLVFITFFYSSSSLRVDLPCSNVTNILKVCFSVSLTSMH